MPPQSPPGDPTPPSEGAVLDFDVALREALDPALAFPDGSFQEIRSDSAFTHLTDRWAEWLLELRRLLAEGGRLEIGLSDHGRFGEITRESWEESRIGMTVLAAPDGPGQWLVFHSEWWLRAHWGRAFVVVSVDEAEGRRRITLRRAPGEVTPEELHRPEPGDDRELAAAQANVAYLAEQLDQAAVRHRTELDEQREEMGRELMRRAFAAADGDWARGGPGSPAALVAAEYEATTSWRLTKPLRDLGRLLRRDR